MQDTQTIRPQFINTDSAFSSLKEDETPFAKGLTWDINANPNIGIGTDNPSGEGQNLYALTPIRSNEPLEIPNLPSGYNKNIGSFESILTQECYYFNFNDNGNHGIYVINGNTGDVDNVVIDPNLLFTDNQENFISSHRVALRVIYDKDRRIIAKFLLITDGGSWQKWINVTAAVATDGFNVSLFPYWTLLPPHFDRRELLEWAIRPPMQNPVITPVPNTPDDTGKVNRIIDQAFQIAYRFNNTDGRFSVLSPYSLPLIINSTDFLNNPNFLPKNSLVKLYAGSSLTESIDVFVRTTPKKTAGVPNTATWGDWKHYDRIYKFGADPEVLSTNYWERTGQWVNYSYDAVFNTIEYTFDNSRLADIFSSADAIRIQNDLPQVSVAHTVLGDSQALANNRYDYNNLSKDQIDNLDVIVKEKAAQLCTKPLRKLTLYAYVGRPGQERYFTSQVGYINGTDTQVKFGGISPGISGSAPQSDVDIFTGESTTYQLNFADKKGFRLYLKGTPYFSDCEWVIVNADNSFTEIDRELDIAVADVREYMQNVFKAGGYFAARFILYVPSDRYIATIGRHNVSSTGDYRNTSTYVYGIANSRAKEGISIVPGLTLATVRPGAIVNLSKEMEVDCTSGDLDVWGNNHDLFYIYCPYTEGTNKFRFFEGYFKESGSNPLPVELFPYNLTNNQMDDFGQLTDKNGFYWAFTKAANSESTNIRFSAKLNCQFPTNFIIPTSQVGSGWIRNAVTYLSDNNNGTVGDCNRIVYNGRITDIAGAIGYSNVAISIKDGATVFSDSNGDFTLIIHNGGVFNAGRNVYVNSGGTFRLSIANCGQVPLFYFDESLVPCVNCQPRIYPLRIDLGVNIEGGSERSVKENGYYSVVAYCADLAGRLQYANVIKNLTVPSFLQRNNTLATYFQLKVLGQLLLDPDFAWFTVGVSNQLGVLKYLQWVGDKMDYVDSNGNVVNDPASAAFCAIYIDSLYNNNLANNFSLLASYQFVPEDRIRVLDNGEGQLFNVATYGDPIDLQILGTNYNQAAMTAGIIPNTANPVVNVNTAQTDLNTSITLFVRYDSRLDKLKDKTGFWMEVYTPNQLTERIGFNEMKWYPVINREVAEFKGYINGVPNYQYPTQIDVDFWDTYLFSRNISIPDVGEKYFNHGFESPNVTDNFGANLNSGGRKWIKNENAKQSWYIDDVIKSDELSPSGLQNGLGFFRSENRKDFSQYPIGGIVMMYAQRSIVFFLCENDWFVTDYQFHYSYANDRGVMITNLNEGLSTPAQKVGDNFGCAYEDTGTVVMSDKIVFWYDRKNTSLAISDYRQAVDISQMNEQAGERGGIQSYLNMKSYFITNWNQTQSRQSRFDVIAGIDEERGNIYVTFRPRRRNTNNSTSYVNQRRGWDIKHQETFVYSMQYHGWLPCVPFTPEGYGRIRGNNMVVEFLAFAAGRPYRHNDTANDNFLNFFGEQCEPVIACVFNKADGVNKIFQAMSQNILNVTMFCDMIFDNQTNSYSYIPLNFWKEKEQNSYAQILRDMMSYPSTDFKDLFRSMLHDGKRMFGNYIYARFVGEFAKRSEYFQLTGINALMTGSFTTKP